jgi:hypothetical protein
VQKITPCMPGCFQSFACLFHTMLWAEFSLIDSIFNLAIGRNPSYAFWILYVNWPVTGWGSSEEFVFFG